MSKNIICYCKQVDKETIISAIQNGARNLSDIQAMTGAGTGTSCKTTHPEGRCCIPDLLALLQRVLVDVHSYDNSQKPKCPCCS